MEGPWVSPGQRCSRLVALPGELRPRVREHLVGATEPWKEPVKEQGLRVEVRALRATRLPGRGAQNPRRTGRGGPLAHGH